MPASPIFAPVLAPAKVNLTLSITGKQADGYHLMDSLVIFAALHDSVQLSLSDTDQLTLSGPYASMLNTMGQGDNILIKAARHYRDVTDWHQHFSITLDKHIPVAAGIGGGSSDAAAMLLALNKLCPAPLSREDLSAVGLAIGADVPVCLRAHEHRLWQMRGIGEILTPVDYPPAADFGLVLINPGISVSTADVFKAMLADDIKGNEVNQNRDLSQQLTHDQMMAWLGQGNSLTKPAQQLHHDISNVLSAAAELKAFPGFITAGMSGSGATVFALFEQRHHAVTAAESLSPAPYWHWAGGVF